MCGVWGDSALSACVVLWNLSAEIRENMMCGLKVFQGFSLLPQKRTTKTEFEPFVLGMCKEGEEILAMGE